MITLTLTVIVCTYNRAEILSECLEAISPVMQDAEASKYDVLVVDNCSTDYTSQVIAGYVQKYANFRYIKEERVGLSYARNAGYLNSSTAWVAYLDDDGVASVNFVSRCLYIINNYNFDLFGGMYYPWYRSPKPKWLSPGFGQKKCVRENVGEVPYRGCISGGIMAVNRHALTAVGGFDTAYGMSGSLVAYGEENKLEERLLENGYSIGFDPFWKMDHLVGDHKYNLWWHLDAALAARRDYELLYGKKEDFLKNFFLLLPRVIYYFTRGFALSLKRYFLQSEYYWQNALLDIFCPVAGKIGQYIGSGKLKRKE